MSVSYTNLIPLLIGLALVVLLAIVGRVPLRYNIRNLTVRWLTTLMTGLAFTLVIALMTGMLAFVNGMFHLTEQSGQPGNVMLMSEGSTDEAFATWVAQTLGRSSLSLVFCETKKPISRSPAARRTSSA